MIKTEQTEKLLRGSLFPAGKKKVAFSALSNALLPTAAEQVRELSAFFEGMGYEVCPSNFLFGDGSPFAGTPKEKAKECSSFFKDPHMAAVFDLSGGDLANSVLPHLDYETIGTSEALFWGYSDLTTVINAIYAKCGKTSVLFQARHFVSDAGEELKTRFLRSIGGKPQGLEEIPARFRTKDTEMAGIVVGGNIRCFLKLAQTEYFPDMNGKLLLLEARSGKAPQIFTFFSQLYQMGVFEKLNGILLGTFTQMERERETPDTEELLFTVLRENGITLPVAKTERIGHGKDALAIRIGSFHTFSDNQY